MTGKSGSASGKPSCVSRIPLVPLRYGVLPSQGSVPLYAYAKSGFNLEQSFPVLQEACYTLRALRPGYVYVFMRGSKGQKLVIHEYDGQGGYQELNYTGLENYDRREIYRVGYKSRWVWTDTNPETAAEVWIGYSTHLWTNRITEQICSSQAQRARHMQRLDIQELTNGDKSPSKQKHLLPISALEHWVEDYKAPKVRPDLAWSCHHPDSQLPLSVIAAQASQYPYTQPRVPAAVVLYDAEALALDLALIASAWRHQILDIKSANQEPQKAQEGESTPQVIIPASMKADAEKLTLSSAEFHRKNIIASILEQTLEGMAGQSNVEHFTNLELETQRVEHQRTGRPIPSREEARYRVLANPHRSPGGARLAKRIDFAKYQAFVKERQQADKEMQVLLEHFDKACTNQDDWLATAEAAHNEPWALASAFTLYDRDNLVSATGLEQSIALVMHGMGQPLPGRQDKDPRFKRLERWIDDHGSPVYMALTAYNVFREKADSVGTLLGANDPMIQELYGHFPANVSSTSLIAESVTTVTLKRMHGKTRWDKSASLKQRVLAAAEEANTSRVLGLLGARYQITDQLIQNHSLSDEIQKAIDKGMAESIHSDSVRVTGNRTVKVVETQGIYVRPTLKALKVAAVGVGINVGVLYFNIINLNKALNELKKSPKASTTEALNLSSALLGFMASITTATVSARSMYVVAANRLAPNLPGLQFGAGVATFLGGRLFTRLIGGSGITIGLISDAISGFEKKNAGNIVAASYTWSGGAAIAIGSAVVMEGALSLAGLSTFIPVVGWAAAAVILLGAGILAGGMWLMGKAYEQNHTPLELWAARSVFGNRYNDGQIRPDIELDKELKLPHYPDLKSEIIGWYQGYFSPLLLNTDQIKALGLKDMHSDWDDNYFSEDIAEFTVLLPGFILKQSSWRGILDGISPSVHQDTSAHQVDSGLVLHIKQKIKTSIGKSILNIDYQPNQGWDDTVITTANFKLFD